MQVTQHWRLKAQRYALKGSSCENCGATHFPPRIVCYACAENGYAASATERDPELVQHGSNGHLRSRLATDAA